MSIQKKSLISTLKSAKKANVVKEEVTASASVASPAKRAPRAVSARGAKVPRKLSARQHARSPRPRIVN